MQTYNILWQSLDVKVRWKIVSKVTNLSRDFQSDAFEAFFQKYKASLTYQGTTLIIHFPDKKHYHLFLLSV